MKPRLTVSQLYNIQQPTQIGTNFSIHTIFFTNHHIYLTQKPDPTKLKKLSLKTFDYLETINLLQHVTQNKITSLTQCNGVVVFALEKCSDLFYVNNQNKEIVKLNSHFQPINQVVCYRKGVATCSDDFTVRIWNDEQGNIVHSKVKHAYSGHTGKVVCLETFEDILASGSQDGSVIFWKNDQIHCTFKSIFTVSNILTCPQSNQFIVFSSTGQLTILNLTSIIKNKKPSINRIIKYSPQEDLSLTTKNNLFSHCFQIDDSFVLFSDGSRVVFVEVNLWEIVSQKDLGEYDHTNVMDMKCIGRVLVYGEKGLGIFLMRF